MNDCTLVRYARLYARYLNVLKWYKGISQHLTRTFLIEKAADGEFTAASASKIINKINNNKDLKRDILIFLLFDENKNTLP